MANNITSGMRCCPSCNGDSFFATDCKEERMAMGGYGLQCLNCNWRGFKLQLVKKNPLPSIDNDEEEQE